MSSKRHHISLRTDDRKSPPLPTALPPPHRRSGARPAATSPQRPPRLPPPSGERGSPAAGGETGLAAPGSGGQPAGARGGREGPTSPRPPVRPVNRGSCRVRTATAATSGDARQAGLSPGKGDRQRGPSSRATLAGRTRAARGCTRRPSSSSSSSPEALGALSAGRPSGAGAATAPPPRSAPSFHACRSPLRGGRGAAASPPARPLRGRWET